MDQDDVTKEQMDHFCKEVRRAVAAERAIIVTSVEGSTNLCASADGANDQEVLAYIICDLARTIASIDPKISVTINMGEGDPIIVNHETAHMEINRRVIDEMG